jgi:hypothetical protein
LRQRCAGGRLPARPSKVAISHRGEHRSRREALPVRPLRALRALRGGIIRACLPSPPRMQSPPGDPLSSSRSALPAVEPSCPRFAQLCRVIRQVYVDTRDTFVPLRVLRGCLPCLRSPLLHRKVRCQPRLLMSPDGAPAGSGTERSVAAGGENPAGVRASSIPLNQQHYCRSVARRGPGRRRSRRPDAPLPCSSAPAASRGLGCDPGSSLLRWAGSGRSSRRDACRGR